MPRKQQSPATLIVGYFMNAPMAEASTTLETAQAILKNRAEQGLKEPALPLKAPKKTRTRHTRKPAAAPTEAPLPPQVRTRDVTDGPVAPPRQRRSRATTTASQDLPAGQRPLPPQDAEE